jgi:fructosamine-3-kinase
MHRINDAPASAAAWTQLGRSLAALHAIDVGPAYGFDVDNHIGTTPQINTWSEDWVAFNRACRLGPQIDLAARRGLLHDRERERLDRLLDRLGDVLPARPKPALLHGDLWSGNALPTETADGPAVAIIDPACSVGDGQADIAMMQLFGGFDASCFAAYEAATGEPIDPTRIAVYQLYHVLNHVNLFGRGYAGQAMSLVGRLER